MTKEEFEKVIQGAVDGEREGREFYLASAESAQSQHVREVLLELAREETEHERKLLSLDLEEIRNSEIADVPNMKITDYLEHIEFHPGMEIGDVLMIAAKREDRAFKLYENLAATCQNPEAKKLFNISLPKRKIINWTWKKNTKN